MASIIVIFATFISVPTRRSIVACLFTLSDGGFGEAGEEEIEHRVRRLLRSLKIRLDRRVDLGGALRLERFFARFVPRADACEITLHALQRFGAPGRLHFVRAA